MIIKIDQSKKKSLKRPRLKLLAIPIVIAALGLTYRELRNAFTPARAIFVLGGHEERERFAARLAKEYPDLPIWVSSGSPSNYVRRIFKNAGIPLNRLHLDYRAKDTLTNFTTLADEFKSRGIDSVYLVTSEGHMGRAYIVGEIVFGSRGIAIKPLAVPSDSPPEPIEKSFRDGTRALLWVFTGPEGEKFLKNSLSR